MPQAGDVWVPRPELRHNIRLADVSYKVTDIDVADQCLELRGTNSGRRHYIGFETLRRHYELVLRTQL